MQLLFLKYVRSYSFFHCKTPISGPVLYFCHVSVLEASILYFVRFLIGEKTCYPNGGQWILSENLSSRK